MNEPAHTINSPKQEAWLANRRYFLENQEFLQQKYPDQCLAVHNGKVIAVGENIAQMVGDIYRKEGNIPLYAGFPGKETVEDMNLPIHNL